MMAIARQLARTHQEQNPTEIRFVASTRQAVFATGASRPVGDASVYVIQMAGHFKKRLRFRTAPLLATRMMILIDAGTGHVMDWGLSSGSIDLSKLGQAAPL
ncbi:hypothetical protein AB0I81_38925 [Nonomuraea sp. NPDC050404]|uniref:hypothetical protein n=1 Tax=Nonomuraea sp. NPDC050404 TaxID=3155783 RepID=UPI0033F48E75